jgi:regulatory protein YycH of two-component signal transduction system YycFG
MRYMRLIRTPLTALLALLLLFDSVLSYKLWRFGYPKNIIVTGEGPAQKLLIKPVEFTFFDSFILTLLVALQIALAYIVWRSWKKPRIDRAESKPNE